MNADKNRSVKRQARSADWQSAGARMGNRQTAAQHESRRLPVGEPKLGPTWTHADPRLKLANGQRQPEK
jgi:hypothetical protein